MNDFTMKTVPPRLAKIGDLWKPLLEQTGRTNLARIRMTLPLSKTYRADGGEARRRSAKGIGMAI